MFDYIVILLCYVLQWVSCRMISDLFLQLPMQRKFVSVISFFAFLGVILFKKPDIQEVVPFLYLFLFLDLYVEMEVDFSKRLICMAFILLLVLALGQLFGSLANVLLHQSSALILMDNRKYLFENCCTVIAILIAINVKKSKIVLFLNNIIYFVIVIAGMVLLFAIQGLQIASDRLQEEWFQFVCYVLMPVASCSVAALSGFLWYIYSMNQKLEKKLDAEKTLYQLQENYYKLLLEKEQATKKFRHDILNHFICMNELANQHQNAKLKKYIADILKQIRTIQKSVYLTGNDIIDAILNAYLPEIGDGISVQVLGKCAEQYAVNDVDLCTIVSNLIINAVEELERCSQHKKYICLSFHQGDRYSQLQISNSTNRISERACIEKLPCTVKKNGESHGIGLRNVKDAVVRNHGTMKIENDKHEFTLTVILPLVK